jgi:hypothetical protein
MNMDTPAAPNEDPAQAPAASQDPAPAEILPRFAPVPRAAERSNGWKPDVQYAFIEALAETGSVKAACRAVGRADHGAYMLRRHPEAGEFRRAWDAALDIGMRRIEDVAMDRALHGHETPVYSYGKLLGMRTVYNDRLLMFMLRNRAPERFGGGLRGGGGAKGENAIDQMNLSRLKKRWRREWDDEAAKQAQAADDENYESIDRKLDAMRQGWLDAMSPRVRALHDAYEEAQREENAGEGPEPLPLLPGVHWRLEGRRNYGDEAEWEDVAA